MKKYILFVLVLVSQLTVIAQKKEKTLFKIDKEITYVSEFEKLFANNTSLIGETDFEDNLQLMVDYKLKLKQAKLEGIDTIASLKKELRKYKEDLAAPFFTNDETLKDLLHEAYERGGEEVRASHILILAKGNDTLQAFKKISELKEELDKGANFEKYAMEYSQDRSVEDNKGDLGFFGVFKMVYPFESAAFTTPVGEMSEITKTSYGYHILKIHERRKLGGKVKVAHLMIAGLEDDKKQKIDSLYNLLQAGDNFEELTKLSSDDKRSSKNGGLLKSFRKGTLPPSFEEVAFSLSVPNSYSKPFKTPYGWHIIKYIGEEKRLSFKESKEALKKKILRTKRGSRPKEVAFNIIEKKHNILVHKKALAVFASANISEIPEENLQDVLITIKDKQIYQKDFAKYIGSKKVKSLNASFEIFKREQARDYVIENLEEEKEEFKNVINTYKNGLIIFELMKIHVWDIPSKEPEKVEAFYKDNLDNYKEKGDAFEKVKGYVENDYQDKIQKEWITSLRSGKKIKFSKRNVKKLKKIYQ